MGSGTAVIAPPPSLAPFVDRFWIYEGYTAPHARERVLPTGTVQIVFALRGGRPFSGIAGPRETSLELDTSQPFSAIGIHFKPGGASAFLRIPLGELSNRQLPLQDLWGRDATQIADRLWEARSADERFTILRCALAERLRPRLDHRGAVDFAVQAIDRSRGARPVSDVVSAIGMSPRHFFDVFRQTVGLSPKAFARVRRFAAVLRRIDRAVDVDWAEIALSSGYFDQSHFNHDFRDFAGLTPSAYLERRAAQTHVAI
jgi:methylphosphotriester-DNA--protein-cysteine methyltransferase